MATGIAVFFLYLILIKYLEVRTLYVILYPKDDVEIYTFVLNFFKGATNYSGWNEAEYRFFACNQYSQHQVSIKLSCFSISYFR